MQSESILNALKIITENLKDPFIYTNRLVFNPEWTVLFEKYDAMGIDIPESEQVEKYIKIPYALNGYSLFSFTEDHELPDCTLVEFQEIEHLLAISYEQLKEKVLALYEIEKG